MSTNEYKLNVEQYEFEPIKGYPILNWKGKRPFQLTQYYPAQLRETHGVAVNGWLNKIFWGDNLQVMSHLLKEFRGKVNLVYIDPPFDSKADYKKTIELKGKKAKNHYNAFEERQYTDIWTNDDYLQFMYERIILLRELLNENGSIYLHCDWHKVHHLRCLMEEVFGADCFQGQIVWKRTSARSDSKTYGVSHDIILFFTKSNDFTFNKQYTDYDEEYIKRYKHEDERGLFLDRDLSAKGLSGGGYYYEWNNINGLWRCPLETMKRYEAENRIYYTKNGTPRYKQYLSEMPGKTVQDIWTDINVINSQSKERLEYPTQKPEALVERIIKTSSNPGDIVFDCFMGSGTTQAVALKLGRRFAGSDINLGAIQTSTKRLITELKHCEGNLPGFEIYNVNNYDVFRNPVQAKELLIEALEIQPIYNNEIYDGEKDGRMVKIMPVNRISTKADLNELITNFDYKSFEKRQQENPNQAVEKLLLVCMGHESDLAAALEQEVGYKLDVEVVDVLRDKSNLEFKRDSEAEVTVEGDKLLIKNFYPMNLLQKLSLMKENVEEWKELVESVMIDWNYDGGVLEPTVVDIPDKNELVTGIYEIPEDVGTIRIKITDLLSESLEVSIDNG
ncbi:site-specific DNA-methyltransferase [Priestia megaterium]|uniref:site-specific DNA-methyltransferase n=1 Tax=Priestia megaterium TaxID=1404 RepID=UPI00317666E1